jgi:hypothetical protein
VCCPITARRCYGKVGCTNDTAINGDLLVFGPLSDCALWVRASKFARDLAEMHVIGGRRLMKHVIVVQEEEGARVGVSSCFVFRFPASCCCRSWRPSLS